MRIGWSPVLRYDGYWVLEKRKNGETLIWHGFAFNKIGKWRKEETARKKARELNIKEATS